MEIKKKYMPILSIALTLVCLGAWAINPTVSIGEDVVEKQGIIGLVVGALVGVVVAVALLPTIVTQTDTLSANMTAQGHTTESTLVDLWPLLLVVGVMIAIIGFAL